MFKRTQWDNWGPQGYEIITASREIYNSVAAKIEAHTPPTIEVVENEVSALERLDNERLAYQKQWAAIAGEDSRHAGAYMLLSGGAFILQQSIPLLWASHIILTKIPGDELGLAGDKLARALLENVMGNANAMFHGSRGVMFQAQGLQWFSTHFPLVTSNSVFNETIKRAGDFGGMPKDWLGFVNT